MIGQWRFEYGTVCYRRVAGLQQMHLITARQQCAPDDFLFGVIVDLNKDDRSPFCQDTHHTRNGFDCSTFDIDLDNVGRRMVALIDEVVQTNTWYIDLFSLGDPICESGDLSLQMRSVDVELFGPVMVGNGARYELHDLL